MMAVEWVISSSVLAALVILLRRIFKGKISLKLQYGLWFLVLVRLLAPFSFGESRFSIMDAVKSTEQYEAAAEILNDTWVPSSVVVTNLSGQEVKETHSGRVYRATFSRMDTYYFADRLKIVLSKALLFIWLSGAAIKLLSFISINFRFARRLRKSRVPIDVSGCELPVYVTDAAETPCLFGLFRPAIYVTPEIAGQDVMVRHVIPHELTHYRHGDHIWSLLRGLCLIIHWYNPIVRRAAELSQRDAELACDEATIKRIGEDERAEYGRTLIRMTIENRPSLLNASTTMTGTAVTIKERISFIARKPETAAYTLAVLLLISAAAVFVSCNGARDFTKPWHWAEAITCDDIAEAYPWYGIANGSALSDEETETLVALLNSLKPGDFEETGRSADKNPHNGIVLSTKGSGTYSINSADGKLQISYAGSLWQIESAGLESFMENLDFPDPNSGEEYELTLVKAFCSLFAVKGITNARLYTLENGYEKAFSISRGQYVYACFLDYVMQCSWTQQNTAASLSCDYWFTIDHPSGLCSMTVKEDGILYYDGASVVYWRCDDSEVFSSIIILLNKLF